VTTQLDFWHCSFGGVVLAAESDFESFVGFRRSQFLGEVRFEGVRFRDGLSVADSTFEAPMVIVGSVFRATAELGPSEYLAGIKIEHTEFDQTVDWANSQFHGAVNMVETVVTGMLVARGSRFSAPWVVERSNLSKGADFRFSVFGPCVGENRVTCRSDDCQASLELKDSSIEGPLLLQSLEHRPHGHMALVLANTDFQTLQGKNWLELQDLLEPSVAMGYGDTAREQWLRTYISTLRRIETSFSGLGMGDEATEVELHRRGIEAQLGTWRDRAIFWLRDVTSRHGHSLLRLPIWCLFWICLFGIYFSIAQDDRRFKFRHLIPGKADVAKSVQLFLVLRSPEEAFGKKLQGRQHLRMAAHLERFVGFVSVFIMTLTLGAYLFR
jgi:hypothetical protein